MKKIYVIHENDAWVEPLRRRSLNLVRRTQSGISIKECLIFRRRRPLASFITA